MASSPAEEARGLSESGITVTSDTESYNARTDSNGRNGTSSSPPSSSSPLILYSPPTIWGLIRGAAINLLLPFVNGLMLGFGELLAHEAAFRLGWGGTKVRKNWFLGLSPTCGSYGAYELRSELWCSLVIGTRPDLSVLVLKSEMIPLNEEYENEEKWIWID
ncbi:MAG: hypothetical protein M1825_005942 [Sarcosagium campestre]|nr:MAG: hypothetical protein M1825_005942 [Sarcosagium campestre]